MNDEIGCGSMGHNPRVIKHGSSDYDQDRKDKTRLITDLLSPVRFKFLIKETLQFLKEPLPSRFKFGV